MAGALALVTGIPFSGRPVASPLFLERPHEKWSTPTRISITIDWSDYGAPTLQEIGVSVNLVAGASTPNVIDSIRSVYIDNTFSNVPVYVYFPDSGQVIVAPPNSVTTQPAMTSLQSALIFSEGFGDVPPTTTVIFTNAELAPYLIDTAFSIPPVLTYVGQTLTYLVPQPPNTSAIFSNVPLGNTAIQRLSIGVITGNMGNPRTWITVSVNGGAPFPVTVAGTATSSNAANAIFAFEMPALPTANSIQINVGNGTISNNSGLLALNIYALTGYQNSAAINTPSVNSAADASLSITASMPKNSIGIFASQAGGTIATTKLNNANIDVDGLFGGTKEYVIGHVTAAIDQTLNISSNPTAHLLGAVWQ